MQRLMSALCAVVLVAVSATTILAQEKAAGGGSSRQAILDLLAQLQTGYDGRDAKGLAACWTENGEFEGPAGGLATGRQDIEKLFAERFAARKEPCKLQFHVNHLRLVNEGLALVEATAEVMPAPATEGAPLADFVLVKQQGRWLIESVHETFAHLPPKTNPLKDLEWMVGDWSSETSKSDIKLHTVCDWTTNRAFLIRKFKVEGGATILHDGTEIIGWDPRSGHIRSWVFDSNGGFGENVWVHDGNRWLVKYSGTLADGNEASGTHILTNVDANTVTMLSKDRVVNGAAQPDIPEIQMKRHAESKPAAKIEEPGKSP